MDGPMGKDLCIKGPLPEGEKDPFDQDGPPSDLLPIPGAWTTTVRCNTGLTPPGHWQDVRHIELSFTKKIDYRPGDIVTIYPKNFPEDVDRLLDLMGWTSDADKPLTFNASATSYHEATFSPLLHNFHTTEIPTLRSLLLHNLDITAIPRRFFFETLAKFTDNAMHRERLLEFTNPALSDEFFDYATRPRRSILEVLADFPSVRLPWRWAPYIFPRLQGRQFSICSGGRLKHPTDDTTHIEICAAIVQYRTVLKKIRQGVCSRYLLSLRPGTKINVTLQHGSFNIRTDIATRPLLLIAPGTGLAPIRSLIFERADWISAGYLPNPSSCVLVFGNRNKQKDFLYNFDWRRPEFADLKVLTAFSRDQPEKIYVQGVIRRQAEMVYRMLVLEHGTVMVCGSSGKMPIAVRNAIVDVLAEEVNRVAGKGDGKGLGREQELKWAEEEVERLEREGRYLQETW
jgi:sulfite reductase alpha subunit-like flavoprotein